MLNQPKEFKIIVNQKEVLSYDFSYLKNGIYEVLGSVGIAMGQLGYNLPEYVKGGIPLGFPAVMIVPLNCLHFKSESDVDSEKIKAALDTVKDNYLELYKKIEDLYRK